MLVEVVEQVIILQVVAQEEMVELVVVEMVELILQVI
tara:strand:+ start:239 stop:349 length:111 start_codon:yes stop_codon:yes gene_type:complete